MLFEATHLVSVIETKKVPIKGDQEFLERLRIASEENYSAIAGKRGLKSSALRHDVERGGEPTRISKRCIGFGAGRSVILALLISAQSALDGKETRARSGSRSTAGDRRRKPAICMGIVRICPSICGPLPEVVADMSSAAM
jgi:hypothetical protein